MSDTDGARIVETLERLAEAGPDLERYAAGAGIREIKAQIGRKLQLPLGALRRGPRPAGRPQRSVQFDQQKILREMQRAASRKLESLVSQ